MIKGRFANAVLVRGFAMACSAIGNLLLTRLVLGHLGEPAMAAWGLVWQTMILLSLLDLGVGQSVVRLGAERGDDPRFWGSVHLLFWIGGAVHAATMGILGWCGPHAFGLSPEIAPRFRLLCVVVGMAGIFRFRLGLGQWLLYAAPDPRPAAIVDLSLSLMRPLAAAGVCLMGGGLVAMGAAAVLCELAVFAVALAVSAGRAAGRPARAHLAEILACGGSISAIALLTSANIYLSGHLVGIHLGQHGVNLYQSSTMMGLLYIRVALLPQTVAFPRMVAEVQAASPRTMVDSYRRFVVPYLALCALAGVAVILANNWAVRIWVGERFAAGSLFTACHVLWLWLMIGRTLQQTFLSAIARTQWSILPAHAVETALIVAFAGPAITTSGLGLAGLPLLQAGAHLVPIGALAHRLRRLLAGKP